MHGGNAACEPVSGGCALQYIEKDRYGIAVPDFVKVK